MSWTDELVAIYNYNCGRKYADGEPQMLPVAHSTANAQIEIIVDENGNFKGASAVDKSDAVTVIPATEDSASRSGSGAIPMPFDDKLVYIAGDYGKYTEGKRSENERFFLAYMNQLRSWCESEHGNKAVRAWYAYLDRRTVMADLIKAGVLKADPVSGKLEKGVKIAGIAQEDSFVRVIFDCGMPVKTWDSEECRHYGLDMVNDFIGFNEGLMGSEQLCYATGRLLPATYKHPSKIRNSGDKAKLFSANDDKNFTYLGRFANKEEAVSISYDFSQKLHIALRWIIQKQGQDFGGMTIAVWASQLQDIPDPMANGYDDDGFDEEDKIPTTGAMYMELLRKCIFGYRSKLKPNTKVMLLGVDAATTGRMNLSFYSELEGSAFLDNIERWHADTAWHRSNGRLKKKCVNSFSAYEIIRYSLGSEKGKVIICDKKLIDDNILRIVTCITEGRDLPSFIVNELCGKASNPQSYQEIDNHNAVLECACGMIRKSMIDKEKIIQEGEYLMSYDPNNTDRSYLYGCLLAVADKAESEALEENERNVRQTSARRYWSAFAQRPYQTWGVIFENLNPYFDKLGKAQVKYRRRINDILDKMDKETFENDRRLDNLYLLGYSHYTNKMFDEDIRVNREDQ